MPSRAAVAEHLADPADVGIGHIHQDHDREKENKYQVKRKGKLQPAVLLRQEHIEVGGDPLDALLIGTASVFVY